MRIKVIKKVLKLKKRKNGKRRLLRKRLLRKPRRRIYTSEQRTYLRGILIPTNSLGWKNARKVFQRKFGIRVSPKSFTAAVLRAHQILKVPGQRSKPLRLITSIDASRRNKFKEMMKVRRSHELEKDDSDKPNLSAEIQISRVSIDDKIVWEKNIAPKDIVLTTTIKKKLL